MGHIFNSYVCSITRGYTTPSDHIAPRLTMKFDGRLDSRRHQLVDKACPCVVGTFWWNSGEDAWNFDMEVWHKWGVPPNGTVHVGKSHLETDDLGYLGVPPF